MRIAFTLPALVIVAMIASCKQEAPANGVYVEISLKNTADIDRYVVFNPKLTSLKECKDTFEQSLPAVMANLPAAIPKDSTVTGWKCSLDDPAKTATKK